MSGRLVAGSERSVLWEGCPPLARLRQSESEEKEPLEDAEEAAVPAVGLAQRDAGDAHDHLGQGTCDDRRRQEEEAVPRRERCALQRGQAGGGRGG